MRMTPGRWLLAAAALLASACRDNGPDEIGPPAQIVVVGTTQSALANTELTSPIQVRVQDADGQGVPGATVTFTITAGGGSLVGVGLSATATTDASGLATAPAWRLGKSAVAQRMRAQADGVTKDDIMAIVQTGYNIDVRFWGASMTAEQRALFTNAAARISAVVVGDIIDAVGGGADPAQCGVTGQPPINETIDDVLIYASIRDIDGQGKILAQAGPCFLRGVANSSHPAVGVMQFDSADLDFLAGGGSLENVIMHEMLHVVGIGTLWGEDPHNLLVDAGGPDPRYTGAAAIAACKSTGGSIACANTVPVENVGGAGSRDSHWREATFNTELMTSAFDAGTNEFSLMTIGALEDIDYVVNSNAADTYMVFLNALRADLGLAAPMPAWENVVRPVGVLENGRVRPVRPR